MIHPDPEIDAAAASLESEQAAVAVNGWSVKPLSVISTSPPSSPTRRNRPALKAPTAVTIKENIVVVNVNSNRKNVSHGFLAGIFGVLDRFGVVVDLISTSEVHVSMAIEDGEKRVNKVVKELQKYGSVSVTLFGPLSPRSLYPPRPHHCHLFYHADPFGLRGSLYTACLDTSLHMHFSFDCLRTPDLTVRLTNINSSPQVTVARDMAILSLVGKQMRHLVGIAGRMFTTLGHGNVNIEMISQGANEINISCVIEGRDAVKALNLIHQSCLQVKPEGPKGRGEYAF